MSCTLYEKHLYLNKDIIYLKNTRIIEYDIHAAGTCILYELGLIKEKTFKYLMSLDKETRNITVGNILVKHPKWNKLQMEGFSDVMRRFMELNDIDDKDVLSINKDSITVINKKKLRNLVIDNLYKVHIEGNFNAYMHLCDKELYLNTETMMFNTKRFSRDVAAIQSDYFINFFMSMMILDSKPNNKNEVFLNIRNFRSAYLNLELDDEYYYDMEHDGYVINNALDNSKIISKYKRDKKNYDIKENYRFLEEFMKIILF